MLHRRTRIEDAIYQQPLDVPDYWNNPLIEALPPLQSFAELTIALEHFPTEPTAETRKRNEWQRYQAVGNLRSIIVATPEYKPASIQLHCLLRDTYLARNCTTTSDEIRCMAIANRKPADKLELPDDWKSTASGHMFISSTGTGKTTFIDTFLLTLPQVIRHTQYKGESLGRAQVVYLKLSIPPDGTLKALCLNFFQAVDELLHTNYLKQAYAAETVAKMTILMGKVATSTSLGLLIVDEFQNLKIAKTEQCVVVFNMFIQLIEDYGISVVTLCTPAIQKLLNAKIAITRKLMGNTTYFPLMAAGSEEWNIFTAAVWPYCYTKETRALDPKIRTAWHNASGGNAAFAVHAYRLAQQRAIADDDACVDEFSFETVLNSNFAALKPAIDALVRGHPSELEAFEDLISDQESKALIAAFMPHAVYPPAASEPFGTTKPKAPAGPPLGPDSQSTEQSKEFEELEQASGQAKTKSKGRAAPRGKTAPAAAQAIQPLPTRPVGADLP